MNAAATAGGLGAIFLWSTTVAVARSLGEALGGVTAAAAVFGVSGLLALASLAPRARRRRAILQLPRRYLVGCGLLFTAYMLLLFVALGLAEGRARVLEVGLLNYLWPILTLLFSVPLLGRRAGPLLWPGTALALGGVVLVLTAGAGVTWASFAGNLARDPAAYGMGMLAAVAWALYSNLARRWAGGRDVGAVDLFLPVTAVVLGAVAALVPEPRAWSARAILEAVFLGCATYAGYGLWDRAMRRGDVVLVAAVSYLTPLLSTLVSCLYLAVVPARELWVGCVLLVAGSVLSWRAVAGGGEREAAATG
jgi:drug/metabolite transporter (DMT)-like permease